MKLLGRSNGQRLVAIDDSTVAVYQGYLALRRPPSALEVVVMRASPDGSMGKELARSLANTVQLSMSGGDTWYPARDKK